MVDPIAELGQVALANNIGLFVDNCYGMHMEVDVVSEIAVTSVRVKVRGVGVIVVVLIIVLASV